MSVVFDLGAGEARLGATVVPIAPAGRNGELRVGGRRGPVLRPLAFGERTRVVAGARHAADARDAVAAAVAAAAVVRRGRVEAGVHDVVALALAGADETAPPFGETALLVARAAGWDYARLMEADAAEVDRLARQLGGRSPRTGWTRFVLAGDAAGELDAMRRELAQALLERSDEAPIDLEDAVEVPPLAAPADGAGGDVWTSPSRTPASDAAGAESVSPAAPVEPQPAGRAPAPAPDLPPAAAGASASAGRAAGRTRAGSASDPSARDMSGVRPRTRLEQTGPAGPRPGSDRDLRLPAFRFDGSRAGAVPETRRTSAHLCEQVPMRTGRRPATTSESPLAGTADRSPDGLAAARGRGRWTAVTAASAAPAPTVAAFDPARPAPAAWGAPEPSLPLVPPGAQPITRRPREAHPWPERTTLEVPSVRDSPAAALQAVDVAELLAAALEDECDLRGVAR